MNIGQKIWGFFEKILYVLLVKWLHLGFLEKQWKQFMQFVKFGLVGISNTIISYIVYLVGIAAGMYYLAASVLFVRQEGEKRNLWKSFCKTFLAYAGTGLVLNNFLLVLQVDVLGWPEAAAPLINLIITIPLNFLLNKLWAFRKE